MKRDRRTFLKVVGVAGIPGLAGCMREREPENANGTTPIDEATNVGMVYSLGGLGDQSVNDVAHQGIQEAARDMVVEFQNAEPGTMEDFNGLQQQFGRSEEPDYDLVCCIGFTQANALTDNALQFPDQDFMLVDGVVEADNVANYVFEEPEGSFQVGHLAGLLTTREFDAGSGRTNEEPVVGFVGGLEDDHTRGYEAGYRAGVAHAAQTVEVRSAYAERVDDPEVGAEITSSMIEQGADVVYHAAGRTGIGVFQAAQEEGIYAIGADADQSRSAEEFSDVIVASMAKRVDTAVYTAVENVVEDDHQGGEVNSFGLEDGGVQAVIGQDFEAEIPDDITVALEESRQAIVDGEIDVPQHTEEL